MTERKLTHAQAFHPSVFILEEMKARGLSRDDLATLMVGIRDAEEWGITRLSLDFYFAMHDRNLRIGEVMIGQLANAFDVSPDFFRNLERAWLEHPSSEKRKVGRIGSFLRKALKGAPHD